MQAYVAWVGSLVRFLTALFARGGGAMSEDGLPAIPPAKVLEFVGELFGKFSSVNHSSVMKKCDVVYLPAQGGGKGRYIVNLLHKTYTVELDQQTVVDLMTGKEAEPKLSYLILSYLLGEGGQHVAGEWQPVESMLNNVSHNYYLQKTVIRPLEKTFGYNPELFEQSCKAVKGRREKLGGLSYSFNLLPKIQTLLQLWPGSEDEMLNPRLAVAVKPIALKFLKPTPLLYGLEVLAQFLEKEAKRKRAKPGPTPRP